MNKPHAFIFAAAAALTCILAALLYVGPFGLLPAKEKGSSEASLGVMDVQAAPLEDMLLGNPNAPNTIIEYASLTCAHCANFHRTLFPSLKERYIDSGKARFVLREYPLDPLSAAAAMLVRCADKKRYYDLVGQLFTYQDDWAKEAADIASALLFNLFEGEGFSKEQFNKCITNRDLLDSIKAIKAQAHDAYNVEATPTFFVNGKKIDNVTELEQLEAHLKP